MGVPLRERQQLKDLAESGQVFEIADKIERFPRLSGIVEADLSALETIPATDTWRENPLTGMLTFSASGVETGSIAASLTASVALPAVCQRCLQPFEWPLTTTLELLLAGPGVAVADQPGAEVWELTENTIAPAELVEEALIMALPLAMLHGNSEDCVAVENADVETEKATPFASLRAQMDAAK